MTRSTRARPASTTQLRYGPRLPRSFYARPTLVVARELLGKVLLYDGPDGRRAARLVEVEAYHGDRDPASHAFRGPTPRTSVMFGRPGHAYVYLSHGVWYCMNVVAHEPGVAGAVLLRGADPLEGFADGERLSGPGLLGRAFALSTASSGADLTRSALQLRDAPAVEPRAIAQGPRVGIAESRTSAKPWRLWLPGARGVSR
ncbi:MAG: DNA-3-methyladenine glycosylase [Chloroflexota bacterium]|nr:DNA-3-methyladenine glycosylase [Candidatus Limnocylindria bacterium]